LQIAAGVSVIGITFVILAAKVFQNEPYACFDFDWSVAAN